MAKQSEQGLAGIKLEPSPLRAEFVRDLTVVERWAVVSSNALTLQLGTMAHVFESLEAALAHAEEISTVGNWRVLYQRLETVAEYEVTPVRTRVR